MPRNNGSVPREILRQREARAWQLRQCLWTHERIAKDMGLERSTITKMLGRLSARANAALVGEVAEEKRAQLEQLRLIADEAMQEWSKSRRSKGGAEPKFLETAMRAQENIRKILGLNAPEQVQSDSTYELIVTYANPPSPEADDKSASAPQ